MAHHYSLAIRQAIHRQHNILEYLTSLISGVLFTGLCTPAGVPNELKITFIARWECRQRESLYVTSTLNTLSTIHGHRYIGG